MSAPGRSSFDAAYDTVAALSETFERNESRYLSADYSEAAVRIDFLDKFWTALGWDVGHAVQTNPYEQEVKVEPPVQTGTSQRRADYAFHLAPNFRDTKFYVEAKRPSSDLGTRENYFQTIRYGWNSRTALAVLTDFREFLVVDCRYKPSVSHAHNQLLHRYEYRDYADRDAFGRIYWLFSREALASGSFDKRIAELPPLRRGAKQRRLFPYGHKPVDEAFLEELEDFRLTLARSFRQHDSGLDGLALTELTQRTLDRLVFMRFLEDHGIEPQRFVNRLAESPNPWADFVAESARLDSIYNGIIFRHHQILDAHTFRPDWTALTDVCERLSSEESPYDFNSIPIHILGAIYERFLGKVLTVSRNTVQIRDTPDVRRSGGVYYTPEHVVRYIVENSVARKVGTKSPAQIQLMKFGDISCGSGSFLLGAYDWLLEYHGNYYNRHPSRARKTDVIRRDGLLYLSIQKKREILVNNIFGIDLDPQAVEVAQLSLSLRLLRDETPFTTKQYQLEFLHTASMKRLLPDLSTNVVHANALLESDIRGGLFGREDARILNAIDFETVLPSVARRGGFDAIVGNPPYIRIQRLKKTTPATAEYLGTKYLAAARGNYDIYVVFVERALGLLRRGGTLGYILPHKFFNSEYGEALRTLLASGHHLREVVHFGAEQVFPGATTYTCLLFLDKDDCGSCEWIAVTDLRAWIDSRQAPRGTIPQDRFGASEWHFSVGPGAALLDRVRTSDLKLGDVADIFVGLQTSADDVFILDVIREGPRVTHALSKASDGPVKLESTLLHPLVSGTDVKAYGDLPRRQVILFPYVVEDETARLIPLETLQRSHPRSAAYLEIHHERLAQREQGRFNDDQWHRFGRSQNLGIQSRTKACVPRLVDELHCTLDRNGDFFLDNVDVGGITLKPEWAQESLHYIVALLNSTLMRWLFPSVSAPFRGNWYSANRQFLGQLPFRSLNVGSARGRATRARIIDLVDATFQAGRAVKQARTDRDRGYYLRERAQALRELDQEVFRIYEIDTADAREIAAALSARSED